MGIIEEMKKYDNYTTQELKMEIAVLLKELELKNLQLVQISKERNLLFEQKASMKLPDMVVPQQKQSQPQPQGQPRPAPMPQGQPRPQPMPQPRPMPQGMPQ